MRPSDPGAGIFKKGARTGREEIERIELARHLRNEGAAEAPDDDYWYIEDPSIPEEP